MPYDIIIHSNALAVLRMRLPDDDTRTILLWHVVGEHCCARPLCGTDFPHVFSISFHKCVLDLACSCGFSVSMCGYVISFVCFLKHTDTVLSKSSIKNTERKKTTKICYLCAFFYSAQVHEKRNRRTEHTEIIMILRLAWWLLLLLWLLYDCYCCYIGL